LLVEQEDKYRIGAQRLDVIGGVEVVVIAEQYVALDVDRLQ
jgi:hypothetical protein